MPLYDFQCTQCEYIFEENVKFEDVSSLTCTRCQGALVRLFSKPGPRHRSWGEWTFQDDIQSQMRSIESKGLMNKPGGFLCPKEAERSKPKKYWSG
jgi:putative FmdB family regulatory protein